MNARAAASTLTAVDRAAPRWTLGDRAFRVGVYEEALAVSPDGATLATASGRSLLLLDARTGLPKRAFALPSEHMPKHVVYSTDGRWLLLGGFYPVVHVVDAETGALVRAIDTGHANAIALASCPGAAHLVFTGGFEEHARLWDLRDGSVLCELPYWEHCGEARGVYVHRAAWSPDGTKLLTVTYQGADLWEVPSGAHLAHVADAAFCPADAAWSADGEDLYLANNVGRFALVNPRTGTIELERAALASGRSVHGMFVLPDGARILCGAEDGALYLLSTRSLKVESRVEAAHSSSSGIALSPDGATAFVNTNRGSILRVSTADATVLRPDVEGEVQGLAFESESALVALHQFGAIERFSLEGASPEARVHRLVSGWTASLSPRAARAALSSPSRDASISIVDPRSGELLSSASLFESSSLVIDDDGTPCAPAERAVVYGARGARIEAPSVRRHATLSLSPNGAWLVARAGSELTRIDLRAREVRGVAKVSKGGGMAVDDLGRVVLGAGSKLIFLGDESGLAAVETPAQKGVSITCVCSTPDGALAAAGTSHGVLLLVRRDRPREVHRVTVLDSPLSCVAFSPSGALLAVSGIDPCTRVFDVSSLLSSVAPEARTAPSRAKKTPGPAAKSAPSTGAKRGARAVKKKS
jgi:WD40 repeat protein